jgi:hypothetical protein
MRWSNPSALSGLTLILLSVCVIAVLLYGLLSKGPRRRPALATVVVGAVGFQLFHFIEHGLQVGYWLLHPKQKPWLTPWAQTGADGLAYWCQLWPGNGTASQRGVEFLHLVGNSVFFAGVIAIFVLARISNTRSRSAQGAVLFQGLHLVEHVLLTATVFMTGTGWGASTMFGRWSGTELSTHRVWWHFIVNGIATTIAVVGLVAIYRSGALTGKSLASHRLGRLSLGRYLGASVVGLAVLQFAPFVLGSAIGDPAPRNVRNLAFRDVLDPGAWWQLADPYVLLPICLLLIMWRVPKRLGFLSS